MSDPEQPTELRQRVAEAIKKIRLELRWKPGKDEEHPIKRIERGHLPPGATLAEYEAIIREVLSDPAARLYVFRSGSTDYPTVVADRTGKRWLVMFSLEGVLETAFPPDDPDVYFRDEPRYIEIGGIQEVLS
ncbi:MAG: hypothetical protein HY023_05280 [Chloroflexi bacterium]|nr:hypothetical protein [Chloroflexota bacterium]MBI3760585.1 hypothetical protein [Chloroflexota bacterium]